MGSTVAIVVTVVAVVLGFLILRKVNDDGSTGSVTPGNTTSTTAVDTSSTVAFTSTTQPTLQKQGTKVQVANSSNGNGVAGQMTTALIAEGFDTADPTNGTANPKLEVSKIVYNAADPNGLPVANALSVTLGGIVVEQAPAAPPTKEGAFAAGSAVILLLGNDLAGKTIAQIQGAGATTTPTTQPQVTAVAPTTT
jgi:LytR cell envelope-related transcriptional attenuator